MRYIITLFFIGVFLSPAMVGAAPAAATRAKPAFVLQAERKYHEARRAFQAAESDLAQVQSEEAQSSRRAMARRGQWIEPAGLWRRKRAAMRTAALARQDERRAFKNLNRARDVARRMRIGPVPQPEPLNTPFWWL